MDVNENTLKQAYTEILDTSPDDGLDFEPTEFRGLHNPLEPSHHIQHERIRHRALAYLIGSGRTQREAAAEMGYTEPWVSQICRQEWFQQLILEEITRTGRSVVDELIKNAAPGSVLKLLELRDSGKSEAVQFNASKELLNRYLGNTTMVVRHEDPESSKDPVEEVERLEREAERLRNSK